MTLCCYLPRFRHKFLQDENKHVNKLTNKQTHYMLVLYSYSVSDVNVSSDESGELSLSAGDRGFLANGAPLSVSTSHTSLGGRVWSTECCFLHFILLFWNQVFTCVSLRSSDEASSMRSGTDKYFFSANLDSRPSSCISVNTVRSFRFLFCRLPRLLR